MEALMDALIWFAAISVGIMAGVYFAFSAFVMRSLEAIESPAGMLAMQSINRMIVKSTFLPIFVGSTLACLVLMILVILHPSLAGAKWVFAGSAVYFIGMFIVTIARNVPLNDRLEATVADGPEGVEVWAIYLKNWTAWNHVRTIACTASLAQLILAISERL